MSLHNQKNIEDMNFDELRQTVSDMRAELTKYKKLLDLYLEDAENSALGKTLKLENGKLKTQIKAVAGELATNVTKEIDVSNAIPTDEIPTESGNYDTGSIYKHTETVDGEKETTYYYYNTITKKWDVVTNFSLMSVFQQTPEGFRLKGDVKVDGSCILTDSLVFDSSDNPIQVQYSADGSENNWHSEFVSGQDVFMRLKIGAKWSDAMKIVGEDGAPGEPGDNATVTAQAMFDALTAEGDLQGIFPAFVVGEDGDGKTQIYINAEMLNTRIAVVSGNLYLGEISSSEQKYIYFSSGANIYSYPGSGIGAPDALGMSGHSLTLEGSEYVKIKTTDLDLTNCASVTGLKVAFG